MAEVGPTLSVTKCQTLSNGGFRMWEVPGVGVDKLGVEGEEFEGGTIMLDHIGHPFILGTPPLYAFAEKASVIGLPGWELRAFVLLKSERKKRSLRR